MNTAVDNIKSVGEVISEGSGKELDEEEETGRPASFHSRSASAFRNNPDNAHEQIYPLINQQKPCGFLLINERIYLFMSIIRIVRHHPTIHFSSGFDISSFSVSLHDSRKHGLIPTLTI